MLTLRRSPRSRGFEPRVIPPRTTEKQIFVHHMGSLNAGTGAMRSHTINAQSELSQTGGPLNNLSLGGPYRNLAYAPYGANIGNVNAAILDLKRAERAGIDGFAVNTWSGGTQNKDYLDVLFEQAAIMESPIKIAPCYDPATIGSATTPNAYPFGSDSYQAVMDMVNYWLDRWEDHPNLARRNGKFMVFGYVSKLPGVHYGLWKYPGSTTSDIISNEWGWEAIGEGWRLLQTQVERPLYIHFCMQALFAPNFNLQKTLYAAAAGIIAKHVDSVGEFFPSWVEDGNNAPEWLSNQAGANVRAAGKEWAEPVEAYYENVDNLKIHATAGSNNLDYFFGKMRANNATLIQWGTWNDYKENSTIAPGIFTRYALFDLFRYYVDWWKNGTPPAITKDKIYLFARKYPSNASIYPFEWGVIKDGVIECSTMLLTPAIVHLPGRGTYEAPAGYHTIHLPVTEGPVSAQIWRDGVMDLELVMPDEISMRPWRPDNVLTGACTEDAAHWSEDFGAEEPIWNHSEYGDEDADGLPNWFEQYYRGEFLKPDQRTQMDPAVDLNDSGRTNLEEYLIRAAPIGDPDLNPPTFFTRGQGTPFSGSAVELPARIQIEDFNLGAQGVAYNEYTDANEGGNFYRSTQVDIAGMGSTAPDTAEGGTRKITGTRPGEWLNYTVNVATAGWHIVHVRYRNFSNPGYISVSFKGDNLTGIMTLPPQSGAWATADSQKVYLGAGSQIMRVRIEGRATVANYELNFVEITSTTAPAADITTDIPSTGTVDTEITITPTLPVTDVTVVRLLVDGVVEAETHGPTFALNYTPTIAGTETLQVVAIGLPGGYHTSAGVEVTVTGGGVMTYESSTLTYNSSTLTYNP